MLRRPSYSIASACLGSALLCGCSPSDPSHGNGTVIVGSGGSSSVGAPRSNGPSYNGPLDDNAAGATAGSSGGCTAGDISLSFETPDAYACHDHYRVAFTIRNGSCDTVTVQSIRIASSITSGTGTPAADWNTNASAAVIPPGKTALIANLVGSAFCCRPAPCVSGSSTGERQDFTVLTSAGVLTGSADIEVNLDAGCTEACES